MMKKLKSLLKKLNILHKGGYESLFILETILLLLIFMNVDVFDGDFLDYY